MISFRQGCQAMRQSSWPMFVASLQAELAKDVFHQAPLGKGGLEQVDLGGLFAPAGLVKSIVYKDTADKSNNCVWPAPPWQVSSGLDDFLHII